MSPSPLPRCHTCRERITFFRSPFTGNLRAFDIRPVNPRTHQGPPAYPVMSGRAYKFTDLADDIQVQRESTRDKAEDEVRDMPWHVIHECTPTTDFSSEGGPR